MKLKPWSAALAPGAAFVWLAWSLMPDAATNDARVILAAVSGARASVRASALVQLAGAALLVPGLVGELLSRPGARRAGTVLMLLGALGMAADAVYHQLAYEMTAPGVARDAQMSVMVAMQTHELPPLIPLLLSFIVGAPVLGWQRRREAGSWTAATAFLIAPLFTVPLGVLAVRAGGLPRRVLVLALLGEICVGLIALCRPPADTRRGAVPARPR